MKVTKIYKKTQNPQVHQRIHWYSLAYSIVLVSFLSFGITQSVLASTHSNDSNTTTDLLSMNQKEKASPSNGVISAVKQDLSRRINVAANELKVKASSQKTWTDGCLGLAKSGEICTQALVEGWRIVVSHGDRGDHTWVYRTDETGRILRLEGDK